MNRKIFGVLVIMLLAVGVVSAYTETDISFYQASGSAVLTTFAQVEGNYWDWPNEPVSEVSTGFVQTDINNVGSMAFNQKIIQHGNGYQWPDGTYNEWVMYEVQQLAGSGDTEYNKHFEVWTVHDGWSTRFTGGGSWDMLEGFDTYKFSGVVDSTEQTVFNYHVYTDSDFTSGSGLWINPIGA